MRVGPGRSWWHPGLLRANRLRRQRTRAARRRTRSRIGRPGRDSGPHGRLTRTSRTRRARPWLSGATQSRTSGHWRRDTRRRLRDDPRCRLRREWRRWRRRTLFLDPEAQCRRYNAAWDGGFWWDLRRFYRSECRRVRLGGRRLEGRRHFGRCLHVSRRRILFDWRPWCDRWLQYVLLRGDFRLEVLWGRSDGQHRLDRLDQPWRRQCRRYRLDRFGRLLDRNALPVLYHGRLGKEVAGRQRDISLTREAIDELTCHHFFDRAGSAFRVDPVIALQQGRDFLARRAEQFSDFIDPDSCQAMTSNVGWIRWIRRVAALKRAALHVARLLRRRLLLSARRSEDLLRRLCANSRNL